MSQKLEDGRTALQRCREQIDLLDSELLRLLNERATIVRSLAPIKESSGLPLYDAQRERQILSRLLAANPGPLGPENLTSIFRCIIRESRRVEADSMRLLKTKNSPEENSHGDQYGSKRI
ncbi:MAG TPA: chorismate mutase [Candidatus Angelobacter sp.]|nr:chorismate mutase [Candidatus Angelobacter sp.]